MLKSSPSKSLLRRLLTQLRLSTTTLTTTTTTRCGSSKSKTKKNLRKSNSTPKSTGNIGIIHSNSSSNHDEEDDRPTRPIIRIATFNASLFSMAPAVPEEGNSNYTEKRVKKSVIGSCRSVSSRPLGLPPKSILKQSPLHPNATNINNNNTTSTTNDRLSKSRLRVSINLPDNEISLGKSRRITSFSSENHHHHHHQLMKSKTIDGRTKRTNDDDNNMYSDRTVVDVLKELDLDILALQEVKADEEMEMKPLSALANALGMTYVFGDSWAPEYGNAVLSKWPIKRCRVQKIVDDSDFRNVLKTTIEVPMYGEVNVYCTELDRLDEDWRMKQIHSIIHDDEDDGDDGATPHILVGGLNSFDHTDYSKQRWNDILKYYEDIGKPTPKTEVMTHLKSNHKYIDAKDYAGEFESVVVIAKGQSVQGTCKYGTRVDYILSSPNSPYAFVPGSYSVFSSKGTSDHHIVKVDLHLPNNNLANHHYQHNHDYATDNNHNKMMKHTSRRRQQDGEDGAVPVPVAYNNNNTSSFNKLYKGVGSIFRKNNPHNNPIYIV